MTRVQPNPDSNAKNRRRSSVGTYIQSTPAELSAATAQVEFEQGELVETGELVAKGCLSQETGDALVAIAVGEVTPSPDYPKVCLALVCSMDHRRLERPPQSLTQPLHSFHLHIGPHHPCSTCVRRSSLRDSSC